METCLWLPVLLESALWRQLQGHDPGSPPDSRQNEKPHHKTVEASDWCPHHCELSRYLPSLCIPKNLDASHSSDENSLHALGETEWQVLVQFWWRCDLALCCCPIALICCSYFIQRIRRKWHLVLALYHMFSPFSRCEGITFHLENRGKEVQFVICHLKTRVRYQ